MDPVYENSAYKDSTAEFRGDSTQYKGQTLCKRTKVLLIVLSVSVVIAVGGLCVLGVLYLNKRVDFESLHAQHEMVLMQLSDQEINNTRLIVSSCKPCEDGWTEHGGKCYFFSSEAQTWFKSRNSCEALKANLVTINTRDVQGFLVSKIKETHWIGLDDLETEGRWVWVNNQTLEETGLHSCGRSVQLRPSSASGFPGESYIQSRTRIYFRIFFTAPGLVEKALLSHQLVTAGFLSSVLATVPDSFRDLLFSPRSATAASTNCTTSYHRRQKRSRWGSYSLFCCAVNKVWFTASGPSLCFNHDSQVSEIV
ncbi:C-type lectin domain family 4 member A-like isoform X1 [Triplophysa rosa]|uniref:C-type lectin domain family 4 member A-like isoform X1 n=1 Tax=Triplophysa rosa TaxID=992332 RepID=UPI00254639A0|nr:C-type lectin domain family 4 member A-like isoform X1 [Triplophysa rosa]